MKEVSGSCQLLSDGAVGSRSRERQNVFWGGERKSAHEYLNITSAGAVYARGCGVFMRLSLCRTHCHAVDPAVRHTRWAGGGGGHRDRRSHGVLWGWGGFWDFPDCKTGNVCWSVGILRICAKAHEAIDLPLLLKQPPLKSRGVGGTCRA